MHCVKQICIGGLSQYSVNCKGSTEAMKTMCACVAEIRSGLIAKLSLPQSVQWDFKLTALSMWRTLATNHCLLKNTANFTIPQCSTIYCLPDWSISFYFELIRHNDWTEHLLQVCMLFVVSELILLTVLRVSIPFFI